METIRLVGGPAHGQTFEWNGGDELKMRHLPGVIDFNVPTTDPIRYDDALYRRSLVNRNLFVWQP